MFRLSCAILALLVCTAYAPSAGAWTPSPCVVGCGGYDYLHECWCDDGCAAAGDCCFEVCQPFCMQSFCGTAGRGKPCYNDAHCHPQLVCNETSGTTATCIQKNSLGLGTPCSLGKPLCKPDLVCSIKQIPPVCGPPSGPFEPCWQHADCQPSYYCTNGICMPKQATGTACTSSPQCATGLVCNGVTGKCSQPGDVGSLCKLGFDCAKELQCNPAYSPPQCRPLGQDGDLCTQAWHCAPTMFCSAATTPKQCTPLGGIGEPCGLCLPELYCMDGGCAPKKVQGSPCEQNIECLNPLICNQGASPPKCSAKSQAGRKCGKHDDCASGLMCYSQLTPPACHAPVPAGSPCSELAECAVGTFCGASSVCQASSCKGKCGSQSLNCWCDDLCFAAGDCCGDYIWTCLF